MRSRDGSSSFLLSVPSLILLLTLSINAKEYLISYRYVVKDATLYSEKLYISDAMKKCIGTLKKPLLLETNGTTSIREIISKNPNKFIDYIHKLGLDVNHKEITANLQNTSTTIMTLKTTCFKVDFNDNFVKIRPIK